MAQMRTTADRSIRARRGAAAAAGAGGLLTIGSSFLPWISTATEDGGSTSITGWGGITGSSGIAGTNLNDVLDGAGTYRPGLLGLIFGAIALIAAIALASVSRGQRPHRITAAVLTLCGLACAAFGVFRGVDPGDAGVFEPGDVSVAIGPWLTALGGVFMLAAAAVIFAGVIDPPARTRWRGIQPR
jgi:hypothetical protein